MKSTIAKILGTFLIFGSVQAAHNRAYCTSDSSTSGCYYDEMRLYNQRDLSDVYCAPTSAAMAHSALTFGGVSYYTSSWTKSNFIGESTENRIEAFADYMGTHSGGTSWSGVKSYRNRNVDFPYADTDLVNASNEKITDSDLKTKITYGKVNILDYGHYTENCSPIGDQEVCTFSRDGGHVVAINGYYNDGEVNSHHFDPWGGVEVQRDINSVPNNSTFSILGIDFDGRPYGSKTTYVRSTGDEYKIVDFFAGIDTD